MTETICPDCGNELHEPSALCPECAKTIEMVEGRGQSRTLAVIIFVLFLIGVAVTATAVFWIMFR